MNLLLIPSLFISYFYLPQFGLLEVVEPTIDPVIEPGKSCAEKWMEHSCDVDKPPIQNGLRIKPEKALQLCDSYWGLDMMYKRFVRLLTGKEGPDSISVFDNANVSLAGIEKGIKVLKTVGWDDPSLWVMGSGISRLCGI